MNLTGDAAGLAVLKSFQEGNRDYLKFLIQEAKSVFEHHADFKGPDACDQGQHHHGEQRHLHHRVAELDLGARVDQMGELRGHHQDPAGGRDEPHDQERLGHERVRLERHLHGVEQLDDHQDQEGAVEQLDDRLDGRPCEDARPQRPGAGHQQRSGTVGEKQAQPDVDDVLEAAEGPRDGGAHRPPAGAGLLGRDRLSRPLALWGSRLAHAPTA